jgi:ketosteroid isomerase-like protein
MSQENVKVVRGIYATGCWDSGGDPLAALRFLDEAFVFVNPSHAVLSAPRYGHDGFVAAMRNPVEAFDSWCHEPLAFHDGGEHVLVDIMLSTRGGLSGIEFQRPEWHVWTLRDEKATRVAWLEDRAEARRLARLDP